MYPHILFRTTMAATIGFLSLNEPAHAACDRFTTSTMSIGEGPVATWRTDYPPVVNDDLPTPWQSHWYDRAPRDYMEAVLSQVRDDFLIDGNRLVSTGNEGWWISQWMDYGSSGREPRMGLTKERGPDENDLADGSDDDFQVWAVGFYNQPGAVTLGEIFEDPCDPALPTAVRFARDTVSIKFLFTDANPDQVTYLKGAPEFEALIDPTSENGLPEDRVPATLRLIQLDIAVKDGRNRDTGWVFGTFGWVGPREGDGLFDNLVPVSLQWGNDPDVYDTSIQQSWINTALKGTMYGWDARPTLGFNGRANGPADNIRSSCISCHAAARSPRASFGLLGSRFRIPDDLASQSRVEAHVDLWFRNQASTELFIPEQPAVATLDYSLQLDAGIFRMCRACQAGDMTGNTPSICRSTGFHNRAQCEENHSIAEADGSMTEELKSFLEQTRMMEPPRQ